MDGTDPEEEILHGDAPFGRHVLACDGTVGIIPPPGTGRDGVGVRRQIGTRISQRDSRPCLDAVQSKR